MALKKKLPFLLFSFLYYLCNSRQWLCHTHKIGGKTSETRQLYLVICHKKAGKNPSQVSHFNFSFAIAEWEEGTRDCLETV